jgi:hypothetical protein
MATPRFLAHDRKGLEEMTVQVEIDELKRFISEVNETHRLQAQVLKDSFEGLLMDFLKDAKTIGAFSWRQYTDVFNDGDACLFRVYDLCAHPMTETDENKEDGYDDDDDDDDDDKFEADEWSKKEALKAGIREEEFEIFVQIARVHQSLPEELLATNYGDGFEIIEETEATY